MSTPEPCPDCGGSGYQPGVQIECLRCDGYGTLRLTQRETGPAFLNRPWSDFERDRNYDRDIQFLDRVALVLIGTIIGVIVGKLIL
jgi:RecJ-like exonuclease